MSDPYVGEIRMFGGSFAPAGWMFCDGQLLPISENETLFNLIGTTYGGDGQSTFALPDLRGRVPIHVGNSHILAETGGVEEVTLTVQQIPAHNHTFSVSTASGTGTAPANAVLASGSNVSIFRPDTIPNQPMNAAAVSPIGGSQPHENVQPYLTISYIISLFGIFPQQ